MAIVFEDNPIFCRAFGFADVERQVYATTTTIYPIGSVTKVFMATMLAQLWERGVIGLEDPLQKYVPEYEPSSPFAGTRPTTLRQLATHTSGLPQDSPVNFWCNFSGFSWLVTGGQTEMTWFVDCPTLLASLGDLELVHAPEVHAHYSNLNIQLLGLALERSCGQPLVEYMAAEILDPLGMGDTTFELDAEQRPRLARGYVCTSAEAPMLPAPPYDLGCAMYSGGLLSTVEDLARFVSFQFQKESSQDNRILQAGTLRRMRTPQAIHRYGNHECYGLGWAVVRIDDHEAIEHNGALLGYHAHVSAVPELGIGIVALSNSKNFLWRPDACKNLARSILTDLADALVAASPTPAFDPATVDLATYEGWYVLPGDVAHLEVRPAGDHLQVKLADVPDFDEAFVAVDLHTFCFASDPARTPMLLFATAHDGAVEKVKFLSHTFQRRAHPQPANH
jgi:CubicO group peptidase (beta-lactamase class C family)